MGRQRKGRDTTSFSAAALKILYRKGFEWQSARGAQDWCFEEETLVDRRVRLQHEVLGGDANA